MTKTKMIDGEKMIDLTPMLEKYTNEATRLFMKTYQTTNIMQMSFNRGEVITVKVLHEANESTKTDLKYDVVVLDRWSQKDTGIVPEYHLPGGRRWVRVYDLKPVGHFGGDGSLFKGV